MFHTHIFISGIIKREIYSVIQPLYPAQSRQGSLEHDSQINIGFSLNVVSGNRFRRQMLEGTGNSD
jgi:hypothetical protein